MARSLTGLQCIRIPVWRRRLAGARPPRGAAATGFQDALLLVLSAVIPVLPAAAQPVSVPAESQPALDPAAAMPVDVPIYIELAGVGRQVDALLALLQRSGIADPLEFVHRLTVGRSAATAPADPRAAMFLNPAMIDELRKTRGVSLAFLNLPTQDEPGPPSFLLSLAFGESEGLRGFVKLMLAGLSPAVESRSGWTLHRLPDGVEVGLLDRCVIAGRPQGRVAEAVERGLRGDASLLNAPGFRERAGHLRQEGGLLAYLQWPPCAEAIRRSPGQDKFARAEHLLSLDDLDALWGRAKFEPDALLLHLWSEWKTGTGDALQLLRTRPLDRTILEFVPADSLASLATSVGEGQARHEALIRMLAARGGGPAADRENEVREEIARAESSLGVHIEDLLQSIDTLAVAMLPPDIGTIARRAAESSTQDARVPVPTAQQILRASLFVVVKVNDADVFDRALERLAQILPAGTATATQPAIVIDRTETSGVERRTYRAGDETRLSVIRLDRTYVLAGRPEVAEAALAASSGRIPHVLARPSTQTAIAALPPDAAKLLVLRVDALVNMIVALRTLQMGLPPDRVFYPPVPSMNPAIAYTLEEKTRVELSITLRDLPILVRHLLQNVPRPPRRMSAQTPATRPQ